MKSALENNPEIYFVEPKRGADWGNVGVPGRARTTTPPPGRSTKYWCDHDLPQETKDLDRLRRDFVRWGYCKVEAALSPAQVAAVQERVLAQAEGERAGEDRAEDPERAEHQLRA